MYIIYTTVCKKILTVLSFVILTLISFLFSINIYLRKKFVICLLRSSSKAGEVQGQEVRGHIGCNALTGQFSFWSSSDVIFFRRHTVAAWNFSFQGLIKTLIVYIAYR